MSRIHCIHHHFFHVKIISYLLTCLLFGIFLRLGTIGAAPVPSAGIVLILTCYETTFGAPDSGDTPYGFGFIIAIDWLTDRFITMFNVMGDTVVAALVSRDLDGDIGLDVDVKADPRAQDQPHETVKEIVMSTERVQNTYKIKDHNEDETGGEDLKKSAISA